jgi:hypothetical protein
MLHSRTDVTATNRLNAGDAVIAGHHLWNNAGWLHCANYRANGIHSDGDIRAAAHVYCGGAWMRASDSRIEAWDIQAHGGMWSGGHFIGNIGGYLGTWASFQAHHVHARGQLSADGAFYTSGSSCYVVWDGWCWGGWAAGGHDQGSITIALDGGRNPDGSQYMPSLQVRWGSAVIPGDGPWGYWCDSRLKRNIDTYTCGLETLLKLKPVTFRYNERFCELYGDCVRPVLAMTYVGLDADEALSVMPEIVRDLPYSRFNKSTLDGTPIKIINAGPVTYALINAVKELHAEIDDLRQQITNLKGA